MAQPPAIEKSSSHARSVSLPSRSHPSAATVYKHLKRLKATSEGAPSSSICRNLCALKDLYESINDFLQLPVTQKALSVQQGKWAEEVLDGSLRLLEVCSTTRDILIQIKESVQELQSALRRKRSGESLNQNEIGAYRTSKKKLDKMVSKCILNMKTFEKVCSSELLEKDSSLIPIIGIFREVEAISSLVFKSLLYQTTGAKSALKWRSWQMVSRFLQNKRVSCNVQEEANCSEVAKVDNILYALSTQKSSKENDKVVLVQNVSKQLQRVVMAQIDLEEGLEPIFRCLLTTRVCLLNGLNH